MTREQMMAYRKQMVDHLEQCKELVKPRERFFKKYHSRLFWSLQRDLNLRVRAENGLDAGPHGPVFRAGADADDGQ